MAGPAYLVGDRVHLRTFESEDVEFVRDSVNDRRIWTRLGGQYTPTNRPNEQKSFEDASRNDSVVQFVVADRDVRVGFVELDEIEWDRSRAAVAYWIVPDHQTAGYGRDALETLVGYAFEQLGLHKLTGEAFSTKRASMGLLDAVGFVEEGRLREEEYVDGEWVDVVRFGLLASERDGV